MTAPDTIIDENPADRLLAHYNALWASGRREPETNAALSIEAIGFARCRGDWIGAVITPWFLRVVMFPGGGSLWGDIPDGMRRYVELPGGALPFTAETGPVLGVSQFSELVASPSQVPDMAAARHLASEALQAFAGWVPDEPILAEPTPVVEEPPAANGVSRRGFFRRLAGKR